MTVGSEGAVAAAWPKVDDIDPRRVTFSYDRDSDVLLVHFDDRGPFGVVDYTDDEVARLIDIETGDVVGVQLEDFLARAVAAEPQRVDLLEIAELRGITASEVAALRGSVHLEARKRAALSTLLGGRSRDGVGGGTAERE